MTREERYYKRHKVIDGIEYKQCTKCEQWFPMDLEHFYKWEQSKSDGLSSRCKSCCVEDSMTRKRNMDQEERRRKRREFYHTNKKDNEMTKMYSHLSRLSGKQAQWQRKNPEKLKEYNEKRKHKNHKISEKEWNNCKIYFDNTCAYCGLPVEQHFVKYKGELKHQDLHKEHVDHEGAVYLNNCVPSCQSCNSSKHLDILDEWYNEDNPNFTQERYDRIIKWITEDYKKYIKPKSQKE